MPSSLDYRRRGGLAGGGTSLRSSHSRRAAVITALGNTSTGWRDRYASSRTRIASGMRKFTARFTSAGFGITRHGIGISADCIAVTP